MKFRLITLIILAGLMQQNDAGPIGLRFFKRSVFYVANETACVVDNVVFFNGEIIPTDDPCETCSCRPPGFSCVLHQCIIKPGCRAVRRDGYCCPEYVCGCEHDGRMYSDGEEIKNALNPCTQCHCQGSSIACAHVDCFYRMDCAPEHVPGECCPRYNNCTSISADETFSNTENSEESSSEQTITLDFFPVITEESNLSEETFSPDSTESNDGLQVIKDTVIGPFVLEDAKETETEEPVEKSEETDTTQNVEISPSSAESDATHLYIAHENPIDNTFLNSGNDLNSEESKEEAKEEEIMTVVDEKEPEVVVLITEVSEVATSETTAPFAGLPDMSEDSNEKFDAAIEIQAMDEKINREVKPKSMKLPEEEEVSTDIVSEENVEPITRDQSEEQTSAPDIMVKETYDCPTVSGEASSTGSEESTQTYEEISSETKVPMNDKDGATEQPMDEVIANEEKKARAEENEETVTLVVEVKGIIDQSTENPDEPEENEETVTLVVQVKDITDQSTENPDEPKEGEQPVEGEDKSVEEAEKFEMVENQWVDKTKKTEIETETSVEEADQSVEEADQSMEESEKPIRETEMSVEDVEQFGEKEEQPTEELDPSEERVNQPTINDPVISSAPADQENRYKALDEAILSAFVPDSSSSVDESFDENMSPATEILRTVEKEVTLDQGEAMITFLTESTMSSEVEVTAMNVGLNITTTSERIQDNTRVEEK